MSIAEELPLLPSLPFREGKPSNFQLAIAVGATKTGSVEEKPVCTHFLHEVNSFVAEVADITGAGGRDKLFGGTVSLLSDRFGLCKEL